MPKSPKMTTDIQNNFIFMLFVIVVQICLLFIGKFLWNKYLIDSFTFIKPLKNIVQLIAIIFLAKLIFN